MESLYENLAGKYKRTDIPEIREKFEAVNETKKIQLLIKNSSAIKRPILEKDGSVKAVGFDPEYYD